VLLVVTADFGQINDDDEDDDDMPIHVASDSFLEQRNFGQLLTLLQCI